MINVKDNGNNVNKCINKMQGRRNLKLFKKRNNWLARQKSNKNKKEKYKGNLIGKICLHNSKYRRIL